MTAEPSSEDSRDGAADHGVDFAALATWMDEQQDPQLGHGPITAITPLAGGTQNIMLRFDRATATGDQARFVLRRPPLHKRRNSDETMRREARVLSALGATESAQRVPHPRLIAACGSTDVLGATFYLAEWIDGRNITVAPTDHHLTTPGIGRRMGLSHVEALAALSQVDHTAHDLDGFGRPDGWLSRQVTRWQSHWQGYLETPGYGVDDLPGVEDVGHWLSANQPEQTRHGIVHGDAHLSNVLFEPDGPEVAALVDWELATLGDPTLDLGWLLATGIDHGSDPGGARDTGDTGDARDQDGERPLGAGLASNPVTSQFPSFDDVISHYGNITGADMTNAFWYGTLACYKLGILIEGTWVRALVGKAPQEVGDTLHTAAQGLFTRAQTFMAR